jgi:site-specific DNA-methyltransferase (adenine-specific)
LGDWWDIPIINASAKERLGYPTQKPEALLERIIKASSDKGDLVLDPFCGCGTAIVMAQKEKRNWIGIDITHLAINLIKWRLKEMFNLEPKRDYKVVGEPEDLAGAKELAADSRYQFQYWASSLIDGKPYGDKKKGADTGIDAYIHFSDEENITKKAIVQVKSGHVGVRDIRVLIPLNLAIYSDGKRPLVPIETGHPLSERSDAGVMIFYTILKLSQV